VIPFLGKLANSFLLAKGSEKLISNACLRFVK
jgi:hypothetical protein